MQTAPDDTLTYFRVGLDDEATELLLKLSVITGQEPRLTLRRLIRDILIEDDSRPIEVHGPNHH
jgi:hypothetical protein